MISVLIYGISGKMGKNLIEAIKNTDDMTVVAGVDVIPCESGVPVYQNIGDVKENIDVIIDFSRPSALGDILSYATEKRVPTVLCTTGYTESDYELIDKASKVVPVFTSANMSKGINLVAKLSREAERALNGFDVEIVEAHHNQKVDAPSGTALLLAREIAKENDKLYINATRSTSGKRDKNEIGISSIRGGKIVGEHEVMFIGDNEIVTIKHQALSRSVFADGAVAAARFLVGKPCGRYDMADVLE